MLQNSSLEINNSSFNRFLAKVFFVMGLGVFISAFMGYAWINIPEFTDIFVELMSSSFSMYVVLVVQVLLIFALRSVINRKNIVLGIIIYVLYAITISFTFTLAGLVFSSTTIYKAFISAAALFVGLAIIGFTTKVDLSKLSGLLFGGLFALIITMFINSFIFKSSGLDLMISVVGLLLFLGITAYDVQKLKAVYYQFEDDQKSLNAYAIYGAFDLYLDFINIFFYLLRIFGRND